MGVFDNHLKMRAFPEEMKKDMAVLWNNKNLVFEYKPSFIFSELTADRDNIPQKAHCDFNPDVIQWELDNYKIASCFGVTPIHPDGCMILVWTEGKAKKFRTAEEKRKMPKGRDRKWLRNQVSTTYTSPRALWLFSLAIPSMLVVFVLARRLIFQVLIPRK